MLMYDVIVIGFGKAGKTLAAKLSSQGKKVALIEKSKSMYGGTCINIACIPTKTLIVAAEKGLNFEQAIKENKRLPAILYSSVQLDTYHPFRRHQPVALPLSTLSV